MPSEEQTPSTPERAYTPEEVAERYKMTVKQVHAEIRAGRLGCLKISKRKRRILERHLQAWEAFTESPAANTMAPGPQRQAIPRAAKPVDIRTGVAVLSPELSKASKGGDCSEQSLKSPGFSRASLKEEMKQWR
jgi:hypothetical protein